MPVRKGALPRFFLSAVLLACLPVQCKQEVLLRTSLSSPASSQKCAQCHEEVFMDWMRSPHRGAWSNEEYLSSLADTGTAACWGCHAPGMLVAPDGKRPTLRESNLMEGVNCIACHAADCPHVSIDEPGAVAAPVARPWKNNAAEMCGICHVGTYGEWLAYAGRSEGEAPPLDCVDCHMRDQGPDRAAPEKQDRPPSHAFSPRYEDAVAVEISGIRETASGGTEVEVVLVNARAGHGIPSGDYGFREVRLEAWFDEPSRESVQFKRFFVEMGNALGPGRNGPYRFTFQGEGATLRAIVRRLGRGGKEIAVLGRYGPDS